ncbi:hypothetical protein FHS82_003196 [Pseudochelatococcus lubricantis]|uniref:Uncharacterized protein n=1 Tax=Pseudochelatococcus lubricantis TaxID=1538102 RepID=A0ABX0V2G6_9HYPH|nr:hypothetical protein [Pseudochelatococcus lubricantis]
MNVSCPAASGPDSGKALIPGRIIVLSGRGDFPRIVIPSYPFVFTAYFPEGGIRFPEP